MPFLFKPFDEMTPADYADLGFKSGLEIHQQILTDKKLFCRCPAARYSDVYDAEILRHMRPTLSELGEYDGTALMEFKTKKEIIYRINHETVCTYEMDDTPPFEINQQALDIALEIAMLMNYKLVSEIHIARKQYLDGSIPTGFQRTTIVGIDGWIPYKNRKIGLIQLGLEEDACREVSDIGHERVYITDRLGMPLIETVTEADMHTPQEVADVANILRRLVRSTGQVRTGIGAARQDVNVSIKGGTRIEIKGVHRIPLIPLLVYNEAMRQYALLQIKTDLLRRGINEKTFRAVSADVTAQLTQSTWDPIRQAIQRGEQVHCVNLKGFQGILSHPTQTGRVFSKEISDRVRVVACLTRLPNILTSESTEEAIDSFAGRKIRNAVNANTNDGLILVWGNPADVRTAVQEIIIRAKEAYTGIPSETRQALADGTNGFERILPGADRMYPDTDLPPLQITAERIAALERRLPRPIWERETEYAARGIPGHLIEKIAAHPQATLFEEMMQLKGLEVSWITRYLFEYRIYWRRRNLNPERISDAMWRTFFQQAMQQPALLEGGKDVFESWFNNPQQDFTSLLKSAAKGDESPAKAGQYLDTVLQNTEGTFATESKKQRWLMGQLMERYRGKITGRILSELIRGRMQKEGVAP
jgi:glutamyl-tRNA(Gln) amidotransferase subunit E